MQNYYNFKANIIPFILLISTQIYLSSNVEKTKNKLCITKDCIITAATLIKNMDNEIEPCTNFYEYVCGRHSEHIFVDASEVIITSDTQNNKQYIAELRNMLDTPKRFSEPEAVWKAKDFFFACMNDSNLEDDSALRYIEDSLGGFPVLMGDAWERNKFNWLDMVIYLHRNGFQDFGFFAFWHNWFEIDERIQGKYQLQVGAGKAAITQMFPNVFLKRRYSEAHPNITSVITSLLRQLALNENKNHTAEVKKIIQLAIDIENGPDGESLTLPLSELKRIISEVDWSKIFNKVFNRKLDNSTLILIRDFHRLKRIVKYATITDKRTVANYIILNLLFSLYQQEELTKALTPKIKLTLFKESGAEFESLSQQLISCVQHAGYLSGVVEYMYYNKYLNTNLQNAVLKMENTIRDQFVKSLENSFNKNDTKWEDAMKILKTDDNVVIDIGATDYVLDDLNLDLAYSELPSHRTDHFVNVLSRKRFSKLLNFKDYESTKSAIESLGLIRKLRENKVTYLGSEKTGITYIGIPPILLRGIMFSVHRDPSLNFGSLGIKIMEGLLNYLGSDAGFASMPQAIKNKFQSMRRCMGKQFEVNNNFYPEAKYAVRSNTDKSLLCTRMAEELIAVRTAYNSYQKWAQIHRLNSQLLPNITANRNQLFWIGYGTINCDAYDEEALMNCKQTPGFPNKIKLVNIIRNVPEFSKDFQCPVDADMNNDHRCSLIYE